MKKSSLEARGSGRHSLVGGLALVIAAISGCAGDLDHELSDNQSAATLAAPSASKPTPVASLTLANGNVIDFYEIAGRGLVTESGEAYSTPAIKSKADLHDGRLVEIWTALRPDVAVPQALTDLQARIDSQPPPDPSQKKPHDPRSGGAPLDPATVGVQDGFLASPDGCNNGCCDYDWMNTTFGQCYDHSWDYSWFLFNYGWSYANFNDISFFQGFVCSASGISTWHVNISGDGGTWDIAEAHYLTYWWLECGWPWCGGDATTSVNTSTAQHLHTYCGDILWD
jgi:hypothetical protein